MAAFAKTICHPPEIHHLIKNNCIMKQMYFFWVTNLLLLVTLFTASAQQNLNDLKDWDKYYFTSGQQFTFSTNEDITKVKVNETEVSLNSHQFMCSLTNGINTIKTYKKKTIYLQGFPRESTVLSETYELNASAFDYNINDGAVINAGDQVTIVFNELEVPLKKIAAVYNPKTIKLQYFSNIPELAIIEGSNATAGGDKLNTLSFNIPADASIGDVYTLTAGHVYEDWWGNALYEGQPTYAGNGGWSDPNYSNEFYTLPNISITIGQSNNQGEADVISIVNPIENIEVAENANNTLIDISNVFESAQDRDISFSVSNNSNTDLINTSIENSQLKLQYTEETTGSATIEIQASTWKSVTTHSFEIVVTPSVLEDPILEIDYNFGYDQNEVPEDWKNDVWINSNFQQLAPGETYNIVARRVPEIIDSPISNNVALPTFTYTIVSGNSIRVNNDGKVTAKHIGPSVIEIGYNEITAYGNSYAACSPINKTYMVVEVIDTPASDIEINTSFNNVLNTYNTYYFTEDYYNYTFTVDATNSNQVKVLCNGEAAEFDGTHYTTKLKNRANIITIEASNDNKTKKEYFVIDARKIVILKENITHPEAPFEVGDVAQISFKGIVTPVYKLATFYNPMYNSMWGGDFTRVAYSNSALGMVKTNVDISQYNLADNNTIEVTLTEAGHYAFKNGHINEHWWGSELGLEKNYSAKGTPQIGGAPEREVNLSVLPDFAITVAGYASATFDEHVLPAETEKYADASSVPIYDSVTEHFTSGSFAFKNNTSNWGSTTSWFGVGLSNRTDNTSLGDVSNQFNSAAGGDVNGNGTYGVVFDANSGGISMGPDAAISFSNTDYAEGKLVAGLYVTNNTYGTNSMNNGDGFAKAFGGDTGNDEDFFLLTAEGFDKDGATTGTKDFYLADYRFENNVKDYIVNDWEWLDLSSLGVVSKVTFKMSSSDVGAYGMNTPAYFCMDNINKTRLHLNDNINDVVADINSSDVLIDLSDIFLDPMNNNINKSVLWNTNTELVTTTIEGSQLRLSFATDAHGTAEIMLKGKSGKMAARTSFMVTVGTTTSINNAFDKIEVIAYPNPCTHNITLKGNTISGRAFKICNVNGQVMLSGLLNSNEHTIPVSHLINGTYIIIIETEQGRIVEKIVKY